MQVKITTPSQRQEFKEVKSLKLQGYAGKFEILSGHENLIALVKDVLHIDLPTQILQISIADGSILEFDNNTNSAKIMTISYNEMKN